MGAELSVDVGEAGRLRPLALTDSWLHGAHLGEPLRTLVILTAHLSGSGILWIARFVLLERVLFRRPSPLEPPR